MTCALPTPPVGEVGLVAGSASGVRIVAFLSPVAKPLVVGVAIGIFGTWLAGRAMKSLLFDVAAFDPAVVAATAGVLIAIVLLATMVPSGRASQVHPNEALRDE